MNHKNFVSLAICLFLIFLQVPVSARMNFTVLPLNQGLYVSLTSPQCQHVVIPSVVHNEIHRIKIRGQGSCQDFLSFLCAGGPCFSEVLQNYGLLTILDANTYLISSQTESRLFIRIWP